MISEVISFVNTPITTTTQLYDYYYYCYYYDDDTKNVIRGWGRVQVGGEIQEKKRQQN